MPHIDEKDLVAMHEQIEKSNKSVKQFESNFYKERQKTDDLTSQRNIFIGVASVLLLLLVSTVIIYFVSPTKLINTDYLDDNGYKVYKRDHVDSLEIKLESFNLKNQEYLASNAIVSESSYDEDATVYAVQVGAFEERMVSMSSKDIVHLKEFQEDEFYKYAVGHFDNLNEAQRFRKELLKIGFNDAFIASYENGRRVKIEEAW